MKLIRWLLVVGVLAAVGFISVTLVKLATTPISPDPKPASQPVASAREEVESPAKTPATVPFPRPVANLPIPGSVAANLTPAAPTPTPTPTPTPKPEIPYRQEVEQAQKLLAELGFKVGPVDGKLGQRTELALEQFQKQMGLRRTGQVDATTLQKLEEAVREKQLAATRPTTTEPAEKVAAVSVATNAQPTPLAEPQLIVLRGRKPRTQAGPPPKLDNRDTVRNLQKTLATAGVYDGEIDGKFGKQTLEAIKNFQKKHKLSPTGKLDVPTWEKLFEISKKNAPPPQEDLIVVAPVSKVLKKAPLKGTLAWYTPSPATGPTPPSAIAAQTQKPTAPRATEQKTVAAVSPTGTAKTSAGAVSPPVTENSPAPVATPAMGTDATNVANQSAPQSQPTQTAEVASHTAEGQTPSVKEPDSLNVASAGRDDKGQTLAKAEQPAQPESAQEVVVKLNPDSAASDGAPLATPAPVSAEVASANPTAMPNPHEQMTPKLSLLPETAPQNGAAGSTYASAPVTVASPTAQVQIESVGKDTNAAQLLAEKLQREQTTNTPTPSPEDKLKDLAQELKSNQLPTPREEAKQKVEAVEQAYQQLKRNVGARKTGLAAMQVARVEAGFKAMKEDFEKGRYERIIKLGDGFRRGIEIVSAQAYVESVLGNESARKKLSKSEIKVLEDLCEYSKRNPNDLARQEKFIDAAEALRAKIGPLAQSGSPDSDKNTSTKNSSKSSPSKTNGNRSKTTAKR
ncbi:MAG: hypothetical protein KatS3mg130_0063 [Candidatus Sumerlaea sp.]|nr:MAG: hypothetical protein KatS3mg130_0063 [Candidatus Sumerlaea sp.]